MVDHSPFFPLCLFCFGLFLVFFLFCLGLPVFERILTSSLSGGGGVVVDDDDDDVVVVLLLCLLLLLSFLVVVVVVFIKEVEEAVEEDKKVTPRKNQNSTLHESKRIVHVLCRFPIIEWHSTQSHIIGCKIQ